METISAIQAFKTAKEFNDVKNRQALSQCMQLIENAIKMGGFEVETGFYFTEEVKNELIALGYKMEPWSDRTESGTTISWKEAVLDQNREDTYIGSIITR